MSDAPGFGASVETPRSKGALVEKKPSSETGKVKPMILLWALGVPIPLIILILLFTRGC
jgi:hypothetical protein